MGFLSKLLTGRLVQRSKPEKVESRQNEQLPADLERELSHKVLERLCGMLSTLLSAEPSIIRNTVSEEMAKAQFETATAQMIFHQRKLAPHLMYPPKLYNDGVEWVAKTEFGDGQPLVGRGECPAAALNDYDQQWLGIK